MTNPLPLRRYPFENIPNFRELGGYPAENGGMTRWGVFFRSARLTFATQEELAKLKALGIRTIIDLRMKEEVETRPDAGMDDPELGWRHLSLMGNVNVDPDLLKRNPDEVPPMSTLYQYMLTESPHAFRDLFMMIAERVQMGAVLFHCTAGKDRTGLTAMFLQAICGVDRLDLIAHYEISHTYNLNFIPDDTTGSHPTNLITTLSFLQEKYGGPVAYLRSVGVSENALEIIRKAFWQSIA